MDALTSLIQYIVTLPFWVGYRTYLSGFGGMLYGLSLIILAAAGNEHGSVSEGIAALIIGYGIIGTAGKIDKLTEVNKAAAVLQVASADADPLATPKGVAKVDISNALATVTAPPIPAKP